MSWAKDTLEDTSEAPDELENARRKLDEFHQNYEPIRRERGIYEKGKEHEVEFERNLNRAMAATEGMRQYIAHEVNDHSESNATLEDLRTKMESKDKETRDLGLEYLDRARENMVRMFNNYNLANENYDEILEESKKFYKSVIEEVETRLKTSNPIKEDI